MTVAWVVLRAILVLIVSNLSKRLINNSPWCYVGLYGQVIFPRVLFLLEVNLNIPTVRNSTLSRRLLEMNVTAFLLLCQVVEFFMKLLFTFWVQSSAKKPLVFANKLIREIVIIYVKLKSSLSLTNSHLIRLCEVCPSRGTICIQSPFDQVMFIIRGTVNVPL